MYLFTLDTKLVIESEMNYIVYYLVILSIHTDIQSFEEKKWRNQIKSKHQYCVIFTPQSKLNVTIELRSPFQEMAEGKENLTFVDSEDHAGLGIVQ